MNKGGVLLAAAVLGVLAVSCSKSEDVASQTDQQVAYTTTKSAFAAQFPTATNVSWSTDQTFDVASFTLPAYTKSTTGSSYTCKAWYNNKGKWQLTVVDYTFDQLSDTVKNAFKATTYGDGSWAIVKVVKVTWADNTSAFKIEVSKTGESNHILYFKSDGTLKKDKTVKSEYGNCDEFPTVAPAEVQSYVTTTYPGATISEVMKGKWGYLVEVKDGSTVRSIFFSTTFEVQMVISEESLASFPQAVQAAFSAGSYAAWSVRHAVSYEIKGITGKLYYLELTSSGKRVILIFKEDGTLFQELGSKLPF